MKLSTLENQALHLIGYSYYNDGCPTGPTWSDCALDNTDIDHRIEPAQFGALVTNLIKKGLADTQNDKEGDTVWLTEKGAALLLPKEVATSMKATPAEDTPEDSEAIAKKAKEATDEALKLFPAIQALQSLKDNAPDHFSTEAQTTLDQLLKSSMDLLERSRINSTQEA